jgi:cytochrome P450
MMRRIRSIQRDPIGFLHEAWRDFGDVLQLPIPRPGVYLVTSPAAVRDVLVTQHRDSDKRTLQYTTLSLVTGQGLLTSDGQVWLRMRRALQPAFHRDLIALTDAHVHSALRRLELRWGRSLRNGSHVVDMDAEMMELALDITGAALFGVDLSADAQQIAQATLEALHSVIIRARNPLPPPLAVPTPANLSMRRSVRTLDNAVRRIIAARERDLLPPDAPMRDMLDLLLDPDLALSPSQVRDEIATFIVAGHETVASALTWAWHLLSHHPEQQVALAADPGRAQRVFDEVLRLYPPAWVVTRHTTADIAVQGTAIPAGSLVIMSPWLVHRHPDAWQCPEEFDPDRFAEGVPQSGYLPFGVGPRLCIGRDMARLEGALVLAELASRWSVTPLHQHEVRMEASVTLRPDGGLPLRVTPRR